MSIMNFFVLTPAQCVTATSLDDNLNACVEPIAISNSSPGVGINLNDNAVDFAAGATVTLTGMSVLPKRIVDDPNYLSFCPDEVAFLLTLPWCTLEGETIFAPPSGEV